MEPLGQDWARLCLGGKGLLFRYLFDELKPGTNPLSGENPLILATGPFGCPGGGLLAPGGGL